MNSKLAKQEGAILITTLIILLLLTVLATSSFQSSTMQERMAAASAQHSIAFQTAESAVEDILNNGANFANATLTSDTLDITPEFTPTASATASGTIRQRGLTNIQSGYSIVQNGGFVAYVFEVTGRGRMQRGSTVVSESNVAQGIQWVAPK
ncbi:MAG: PilX N-terminal domain-containing pilus assembly protein [Candidatus Polarisedimenticolaceae bacterium]|nr:PilX N-terminal domain-containing pilus assembly protein [Candidatus Polarisedimenticolaceae bacterium]